MGQPTKPPRRAARPSPRRAARPRTPPPLAPVRGLLFITGATGAVGEELLERYLASGGDGQIRVLVRGGSPEEAEAKWKALLAGCRSWSATHAARVRMVVGDVTAAAGLGLSEADRSELQREATRIVHSAANTKFSARLEDALAANTAGTENVLDFAARCRKIERMAFISTVYVAGKRTGRILEPQLEHEAGFVNA